MRQQGAGTSRRAVAPAALSALAITCAIAAPASANTWFKVDPHVHSSNVSGDSAQDLGLIADAGKRLGFDAMFITDHTASHVKEIGGVISNHLVLDDDLLQWPPSDYAAAAPPGGAPAGGSGPESRTAALASTPLKSGSQSLHVAASSAQYSESFVWTKRGPSLHAADIILKFSAYPTRIDFGSGMFVSVAIGGDETMDGRPPIGFSTPDEIAHPAKHDVLIWQIGRPRPSSSDPAARMIAHDLDYTLNQWNDYTINVSQAIRDEIPAADQPHDMNALTMIKLAAAANGGTADGYFDAFKMDASGDLTQGQEFVRRNQIIHDWDTPDFRLFPSQEVGYSRHAQRFYFPITDPARFSVFKTGIAAIPDIQAGGYPAQLNHPGLPGGVTSAEAISNQDYGAEVVETSERGETGLNKDVMTDNWDAVLKQGVQVIGTWTSDSHRPDKMGPASYLYASSPSFDALMRTLFEGRQYDAYADFAARAIFNVDGSDEPAAARYPIVVSPDAQLARVRLKITGGIPHGSRVVWVRNGEIVDSEAVSATSFDEQRSFPISGPFTYVRAELRSSADLRLMQTQPLFFRAASSMLPAGMTYAVTGVTTPSGAQYVNAAVRGITGSSWNALSQTLQATLTDPAGSLAELRLTTGGLSPSAVAVDDQAVAAAASGAAYDAATASSWRYDRTRRVLVIKALAGAAAGTANVVVTFADDPMTPPPSPMGLTSTHVGARDVGLHWTGGGGTTAGYRVYRDGELLQDLPLGTNDLDDLELTPGTRYSYAVEAYNVGEGLSARTGAIVRETDAIALRTVDPVADTYVDVANPGSNYGRSASLRTDRDEDGATRRTYLRFVVPDLGPDPVSAVRLRMYGNSASNGQDVHPVPSTTWSETATNWDNRPAESDTVVGSALKSPSATWVIADLDTSAVSSGRTVSFALDARSTVSAGVASRESANRPQLEIETQIPANRVPTAGDVSVSGGSATNIAFSPVVSDADGDVVTCEVTAQPAHGTASVAGDCSAGSYRSASGFGGSDAFGYRAVDSHGLTSDPAKVTVDVDRAPTAGDVSVSGASGTDIAFSPMVADADGDAVTCEVTAQPAHGTASVAGDCSAGSYRSASDFGGSDAFGYRAIDSHGVASATATVTVSTTTVLFADGFESSDLSRWGSWRNVSVIASNAHSGQRSLLADTGNGNAWTRRTLGA
ncbi:MAG: acid phosphatase type 7, partial [Solirubrobacteraceae bacterium]|nr:acid phosphatase type 7 [Solirubrobacteraceae bacterium]